MCRGYRYRWKREVGKKAVFGEESERASQKRGTLSRIP